MIATMSKLLGNSVRTVSNWKNEKRPIVLLLEKYFTKDDLQEFLELGYVSKYEKKLMAHKIFDVIQTEYIRKFLFPNDNLSKAFYHLIANSEEGDSLLALQRNVFDLNTQGILNKDECLDLIKIDMSDTLISYININQVSNWSVFKDGDFPQFWKTLHEIKLIAADKGRWDELFDYKEGAIPNTPADWANDEEIDDYNNSLNSILQDLIKF